jgi:metal-responsive CopG/Arc/MetJ family transcriptional regulator
MLGYTFFMRVVITIPKPLFEEAEKLAEDLAVSRNGLFEIALRRYLERPRSPGVRLPGSEITAAINRALTNVDQTSDPLLEGLQHATLLREPW